MQYIKWLLFPIAFLYGCVVWLRNKCFDLGILPSQTYDFPVISVGNLSMGGTGKSPHVEYLIRLLSPPYRLATLSRGYKRHSTGFVLADTQTKVMDLGDEPFQFHRKFPHILVAVDANRREGIAKLRQLHTKPEVIVLDDAFQHRYVKPGLSIVLTPYNDLIADDFMVPVGRLREFASGIKRADIVIVTKCTDRTSISEKEDIRLRLKLKNQALFFSKLIYDDYVYGCENRIFRHEVANVDKLLLAGIANPAAFFRTLQKAGDEVLVYPDHHAFSETDVQKIIDVAQGRPVVTTEKDYVRLLPLWKSQTPLYYLPIQIEILFDEAEIFNEMINNYVGKSSGNSSLFAK